MIYVCNLHEMPGHVAALGPTHLISLVAPGELPATPAGIELERHLRIEVHDISEPLDGHILPEAEHVAQVIDFLRAWSHADGALAGALRRRDQPLDGGGADRARGQGRRPRARGRAAAAQGRAARLAQHPDHRARRRRSWAAEGRLIAAREAMGPAELTLPTPLVRLPLLD